MISRIRKHITSFLPAILIILGGWNFAFSQSLVNVSQNAIVNFGGNSTVRINGAITFGTGATLTQQNTGQVQITGSWTNNGATIDPGTGNVTFLGTTAASILGTGSSTFYDLVINKTAVNVSQLHSVTVNNNLLVSSGGFVTGAGVSSLTVYGNITNNATLDLYQAAFMVNTTFRGAANSVIGGTGATNDYGEIIVNKDAQNNEVQVSSTAFTALPTGYLTLTQGTFHMMGSALYPANVVFKPTAANYSIPTNSAFWLDNTNVTVTGQNATANLGGRLRISSGTFNVGTGANQNHLLYSTGSEFIFESGTVNILSRFSRGTDNSATINYNQSGGQLNIGTGVSSSANDRGSFDIGAAGSTFNWSAGTIELRRNSSNTDANGGDYIVLASTGTVSSPTILRINQQVATQTHRINSVQPVGELLMLATNNPVVRLLNNNLTVFRDVTIAGTGGLNANNLGLTLGGQWINNGSAAAFTAGTGRVTFNGSTNQDITGTFGTTFYNVSLNKSAGKVFLQKPTTIGGDLRLISTMAKLDILSNDLTLGTASVVYSDDGVNFLIQPGSGFTSDKCILFSVTDTTGGSIYKLVTAGSITNPTLFGFPVGTKDTSRTGDVYTPARIVVNDATVAANSNFRLKVVPMEHPNVRTNSVSLKKYWRLYKSGITLGANRADLRFWYDEQEVVGVEANYRVLKYLSPNWLIDPGISAIVSFNTNEIISERPADAQFNGDWTAGEEAAARAKYYSIANGNYSDPNTWSKISYGGPVSNTAPNDPSDNIFVGDNKTVTLTANPPNSNKLEVQNTGTLLMANFLVGGDTLRVKSGARLGIGHGSGIVLAPTANGNVRTTYRSFDTNATYMYTGGVPQVTGDALPLRVKSLICNKTAGQTLIVSNNVTVGDSLWLVNGIIDDNGKIMDGETAGRTFRMDAGEFILRKNFPLNYTAPTLTAGRINFNGTSNIRIPSSGSTPGILQYNDLTIRGNRGFGDVVFEADGEIKISGVLDISALDFQPFNAGNTRLRTDGSTIVFNGANQNIPVFTLRSNPGGAFIPDDYRLFYHNLKIAGTGTKSLITAQHRVYNEVILESATFALNTQNIEVRGNWNNTGGTFTPATNTVIFNVPTAATTKTIVSRGEAFHHITIQGLGTVQHNDNPANNLNIRGNWTNTGDFNPGTGTVAFIGTALQTITNTNDEDFYNLVINNNANVQLTANTDINVLNNLSFFAGRLDARTNNRYVAVNGTVGRTGSGHVDGNLRINIPAGAQNVTYHIGNGASYRPATLNLSGTDGVTGYLNIIDNARTVNLAGSGLNATTNVERQWDATIPAGSNFSLGTRTYDLVLQFINPGDLRGGADPLQFVTRRWTGSAWVFPQTGTRTSTTTQSLLNNGIGSFVIGPPGALAFYSIADGNWTVASTWSTAGYGGAASSSVPSGGAKVYIGDGKSVTLNANYATSAGDSIIVETAGASTIGGKLILNNNITGNGIFALRSGGTLVIKDANGITAAANSGNIRTNVRNYNEGTHNRGHFVYNGTANQTAGDGLPATVATLTIDNVGNNVTLSSAITVQDSLNIIAGTFDVSASNLAVTMNGNWRSTGSFNERSGTVSFTGSGLQLVTNSNDETFYNLTINKSAGRLKLEPSTDITISNTLTLTSGIINARDNSLSVTIGTAGTVSRTSGHIDGEMRKNVPTGTISRTFEVGYDSYYTPVISAVNGAGGTAGNIGAIAYGSDHPSIATSGLDMNKNVQRYWRMSLPAGSAFDLGGRTYDLTVQFLNPDDIRGGANTNNFVLRQYTGGGWNGVTSGTRTATTTQGTGIITFGDDFVVGELGTTRIFYTRQSGPWNDINSWSNVSYGGAASVDYPNLADDIAYIGNNNEIDLDQDRSVSSVTVEDVSGMGVLDFGAYVLSGNQFVLKSGGKLKIGSVDGITSSGATGNVQTTIRNYNHNTNNNGHFEYIGAAQNTGNGLPADVASLTINTSATTLLLTSAVNVSGNIDILAGTFSANSKNISLKGNWTNNSAFTSTTATVTFNGSTDQNIQGSQSTTFSSITLNKTGGSVSQQIASRINGTLSFAADGLYKINTYDLTFGPDAATAGTFSALRMIQTDGSATAGNLIKLYNTGNGVSYSFTFPVGVSTEYNGNVLNLYGNFAAGSQVALKLLSGLHPGRLTDNILKKYWNLASTGVTLLSNAGMNFQFAYQAADVNGTQASYIPARYNSGWEVNLGTSRSANPSPINVVSETGIDGDWTAGEPGALFTGRVYYSRANAVDWNVNTSWSNISHVGATSAYWPGEKFATDTVIIANNNDIYYGVSSNTISMIRIGDDAGSPGLLSFRANGTNKSLKVLNDVDVRVNGRITETGAGNRSDTLKVGGNFINNNNVTANAIDFRPNTSNRFTQLVFDNTGLDTIRGAGNWRLSGVQVKKDGLADAIVNQSSSFSTALSAATQTASTPTDAERFVLSSGVYCHDNANASTILLDINGNADGTVYQFGVNSGLRLIQGDLTFNDEVLTNTSTLLDIRGGFLRVGTTDNEDLKYNSGTTYLQSGGETRVMASFSKSQPNSTVDFNISGGIIRVVIGRNVDGIGFDVSHSSSTFTQSGGTIVIQDVSSPGDYIVNAATVNVTGGTLQIGELGDPFFTTGGDIAVGNLVPTIYNLRLVNTRSATNLRALICSSNPLYVINDVTIEVDGCLDLNTYSMEIGGNIINRGAFDTDGPGWDNGGGVRTVRLVGEKTPGYGRLDQTLRNENAYVVAQDPSTGSYRNEAFYELLIDKPNGGKVILDNTANSNLIVRNLLQFAQDNTAIIDARTNNKYVYANGQLAGEQGRIERVSEGHVDGTLRRDIGTADQTLTYYIGKGFDYTPATISTVGAGGTAGSVDMIAFGNVHPNIASNALIDQTRDIERYWKMSRPSTSAFAIGGRTYNMTLQFLSSDIPGTANWSLFEQYLYPNTGPWTSTIPGARTSNSTQSVNNTVFNNDSTSFIIGESASSDYYSVQDGPWSDVNSWSTVGYGIVSPPGAPPSGSDALVHVGDGKTIWLDRVDSVKALIVENVGTGGPGKFDARTNFILGQSFTLEDSCTFITANEFGIRASSNAGSIRTTQQRNYGVAHYTYNSQSFGQSTGDGLPSGGILSLTIDNSAVDSASSIVFLLNDLISYGDVYLKDGRFFASNKLIQIQGDLINDNGAILMPVLSTVEFNNTTSDQFIELNDPAGVSFYNLSITKPANSIVISGSASGDVHINNRLRFSVGNSANLNSRLNNRKVIIRSTGTVERLATGHVDGTLQKYITTAASPVLYEIGDGAVYTPATLSFDLAGGTAGPVDAINYSPVPLSPFFGNRMDPFRKVDRYWKLEPQGTFALGSRKPNLMFQMPASEISNITLSNTVIRRRNLPAAIPLWTERLYQDPPGDLVWNTGTASVTLKPTANFWEGLGEFYIGEKAKRIFYSRNGGGNWDNNNSWAFDAAGTILAPAGEYPNADWSASPGYEYEKRDSVIIQNNDVITLNTRPELANIEVKDNSRLTVNDTYYIEQSHTGISNFEMRNNAWLDNKSAQGIQTDTSQSIIRMANRFFDPTTNFEFSGNIPQTFGDAFPSTVNDVVISNSGAGINGIVAMRPNVLQINGDLTISTGELRPLNATSATNLVGDLTVNGTLNGTLNSAGAAVSSEFTFQGNSGNQNVTGSGSLTFYNMNMDMGATAGVLSMGMNTTVTNVLDLQTGANANNQIVSLANNINLYITNTNPNAIIDYTGSGVFRYIRTSTTSGSLFRSLIQSNVFTYPVGSYEDGANHYTPAVFTAGDTGTAGTAAVRVSRGTNPGPFNDGHLYLHPTNTTDWLKRYWAIDNVTTTILGSWRFNYVDPSDISGQETDIISIGRWRPVKEGAAGMWLPVSGSVVHASDYFETAPNYAAIHFEGDWTAANLKAFPRIFYSRQSGLWNNDQTWTYSFTHAGPIYGPGIWPDDPLDSVIVGGGNAGIGNHEVVLNVNTPVSSDYGVTVGTGANNTGTLDCGNFLISGGYFSISNLSTLKIGSPQGITSLGTLAGNIQTTITRTFSGPGINPRFEYNGTTNQVIGSGLPNNVRSLGILNTGISGNNIVSFDRNISIMENLYINSGVLDINTFSANNTGGGAMSILNGAGLMLGGTNDLSLGVTGYSTYNIGASSIIEFYGTAPNNQTINNLPPNLTQNFILNTGGLGHVILRNSGTKFVNNPLLIRGDLTVINNAQLENSVGVDALSVRGNVINSATINNEGVIEIGN